MSLRFKVGEIAIIRVRCDHPLVDFHFPVGSEIEVVRAGPFPARTSPSGKTLSGSMPFTSQKTDYEIRNADGFHIFCDDHELRKRPQSGIPDEVRAWFDVPVKRGEMA